MSDETKTDRLARYRIEGAVDFIGGIIKGALEHEDEGLLLCAQNAEKALRELRKDNATLRSDLAAAQSRVAECMRVGPFRLTFIDAGRTEIMRDGEGGHFSTTELAEMIGRFVSERL